MLLVVTAPETRGSARSLIVSISAHSPRKMKEFEENTNQETIYGWKHQ